MMKTMIIMMFTLYDDEMQVKSIGNYYRAKIFRKRVREIEGSKERTSSIYL